MVAEIDAFKPLYLDRITQLTNKTNQFNLTTKRYTLAEMEAMLGDPDAIGIYGKLGDRFGDNGLISVVLGRRQGETLEIELWLMSCRVLKRDMEQAMLDALVEGAQAMGVQTLRGIYVPTKKNGMVKDHYTGLGFEREREESDGSQSFTLPLAGYAPRNRHIRIMEFARN